MKITRLAEKNNNLKIIDEDINLIRHQVREFIDNKIDSILDNIAIELASEVHGYEPDWCYDDSYGELEKDFDKIRAIFLSKLENLLFAYAPVNDLTESNGLNESSIKDAFREIQNKLDPKGARARTLKDTETELAKRAKEAERVLATDFELSERDATFYPGGDLSKPMSWDDWKDKYANVTPENAKEFAEWYNAIVLDSLGYYIRRGAEDLRKSRVKCKPAMNSKISKEFMWQPNPGLADKESSTDLADNSTATSTTDSQEQSTSEADKTIADEKSSSTSTESKLTATINKLKTVIPLTGLNVVDKYGTRVNFKKFNPSEKELASYRVVSPNKNKSWKLNDWLDQARREGMLEYLFKQSAQINENLLTEGPAIKLDTDMLMDPDKVDFKTITKDLERKEQEKTKQKAIKELQNKLDKIDVSVIANELKHYNDVESQLNYLHDLLVPSTGKADSVAGELVRAIVRLIYRDKNDGDKFYEGYGLETCGSSAQYLANRGFEDTIYNIIETCPYRDEEEYSKSLIKLGKSIIDVLTTNPELFTTINTVDSRSISYKDISERQPLYDRDIPASDDVIDLIDNGIVSYYDLVDYVQDQLSYNSELKGAEFERPYGAYVTVTNLTRSGCDYIDYEVLEHLDSFWEEFVNDHSDESENTDDEF